MSWSEPRSYSFDVRDKRFEVAARLIRSGDDEKAEKAREILRQLREESAGHTNKKRRIVLRASK